MALIFGLYCTIRIIILAGRKLFFIPLRPLKIKVVKVLDEFIIPFSGLKNGIHHFDFEVNDQFFACFENSEITHGSLNVSLALDKKSVLLVLNIKASGTVIVPCDRCGDDFEFALDGQQSIVVKFGGEESENTDEDVIYLSFKDHEINVAQPVYETISLALPYKRNHDDGKCNPEALKKIKLFSKEDLDKSDSVDPRWEALKKLKFKDNKKK